MGKIKSNRSDGRYNISFKYNKKVYCVTGRSYEEAVAKKGKRLEALKAGVEKRENPTLNDYYEIFTSARRDKVKASTLRSQACQFKDAAAVVISGTGKAFGDLKMSEIKSSDVLEVQKTLRDKGKNTTTVNNIVSHVSHVFNKAVRDRTITWNPCSAVDPLQKVEAKCKDTKHRALSLDESSKFFKAMTGSFYENICRLMIQTGMRIGEIGALRLSDFDFKEGVIHVTKTIARSEDGGYFISDTPKTDSGFRDIPINSTIKAILKDQMQLNEMMFGSVGFDVPVFRSFEGELLREYFVNREIKRKCKQLEIEPFTTHCFRATFATRFIEQRPSDYKILSEILGHADIKITLNLYAAHKSKALQAQAMDELTIAM